MRQAGRYLRNIASFGRKPRPFSIFAMTPALAVEATLQPIRRFGFDAAILFSDILVIPDALGQRVSFESGEGPRLDPIGDAEALGGFATSPTGRGSAPCSRRSIVSRPRCRTRRPDWLLRRALDSGELHDRGARHPGPGAGAALRLSISASVPAADRPARRSSAEYLRDNWRRARKPLRSSIPGPASCRPPNLSAGASRRSQRSRPGFGRRRRMRRSSPSLAGRRRTREIRAPGHRRGWPRHGDRTNRRRRPAGGCRFRAISIPWRWSRADGALTRKSRAC